MYAVVYCMLLYSYCMYAVVYCMLLYSYCMYAVVYCMLLYSYCMYVAVYCMLFVLLYVVCICIVSYIQSGMEERLCRMPEL